MLSPLWTKQKGKDLGSSETPLLCSALFPHVQEVPRERRTAAEESEGGREERSKGQGGRKARRDLSVVFFSSSWGRMKALQKNQGRTDQLLGAMADLLTSVAIPKQQWVSLGWWTRWNREGILLFSGGLEGLATRLAKWDSRRRQKS